MQSSSAYEGDDIRHIVIFECFIWSPVVSSWCLEWFLPYAHCRPQWHRDWYLQWPVQQTPGHYKRISCSLSRICHSPFCLLTKFISKIAACVFYRLLHLIPTGDEHTVWNQFLRGLTDHCFCLRSIPPSYCPHATSFELTHLRHWTFHFWKQVLWSPEFTFLVKGTHIVEDGATLVRRHVEKFNVCTSFSHRLWEGRSAIIKPCLCELVIRSSTVHPVRVRIKFMQCLIFSNSLNDNSLRQWRRHVTSLHRKPLFVIFDRLSYLVWRRIRSSESIAHAAWRRKMRIVLFASWFLVPCPHSQGTGINVCVVGRLCESPHQTPSWCCAGRMPGLQRSENLSVSSWIYDMEGHVKECVERFCEFTNKTTQQLFQVSTPCLDDHQFKKEELEYVREVVKLNALKLSWNVYIWHVSVTLIFYGQSANLHMRSQNGPELVTNV